ncbi:hypothetical protein PWT90_00341 [Aphanocladium album]|nr:hypothetical protein PWT90_00341 [Aphanocladium album]
MGLLADRAKTIIASSKISPVEKNILTQTFLTASCDAETAAREILDRVAQDGVPQEEALRGLKHDWYRVLELLSTTSSMDAGLLQSLLRRDKGNCCLTGATAPGIDARPFHVISPALLGLWANAETEDSTLSCLTAYLTPVYAQKLYDIISDTSSGGRLKNALLLSPVVGETFSRREIWLAPIFSEMSTPGDHSADETQQYGVFGFAPEDDPRERGLKDGVQLFECSLHTDDLGEMPLTSRFLLQVHGYLARAIEVNDNEREVAKPWPPGVSQLYWHRRWQVMFRVIWRLVPAFIRCWVYRQLVYRGHQSSISEIVYSLPLGLYAKFCGDAQGEPAALKLLEKHAPTVPAPLFVDTMPLVADGKPWLIMTGMPGQRVDEVIHRMTYPERHQLADDLAHAMASFRNIPNTSNFLIASASGSRLQDPRASTGGCGPYHTEAEFNRQIARGREQDLMQKLPHAYSREHQVVFTHADLFPSNILVDAGRLSGIVDWQFAGFYPAYWEYTKAMRSVRHAEHYQAIFRRIFQAQFDEELEVEEYLSIFFPIWGPKEPDARSL